jgi:tetratricopeptide (TPR) repeat protein
MASDPWIDQQLGTYKIVDLVASGGMGTVYRALHPTLERYAAIKLLRADRRGDPGIDQRFLREAQAVARLRHPHIIQLYDFGTYDNGYYMILEFVEGDSLYDCLQQLHTVGQRLPHDHVQRIAAQMADALTHVHRQGMVHRDIKPANILLSAEGDAILADFGIARSLSQERQTASGAVLGTPAYIAPEQAQGQPVDHRADVYALAVVVYEMLAGRPPFVADDAITLVLKHIQEPVPPLSQFAPDVPPLVENALLKALSKSPDDRYQSMPAFQSALEDAWRTSTSLGADLGLDEWPMPTTPGPAEAPSALLWPEFSITDITEPPPTTGNLPALRAGLVGRRAEIDALKAQLCEDSARIGLVGMGGIGKTALALAVAHELALEGAFRDGIFWVDGREHTTLGAILIELADLLQLDLGQGALSQQRRALTYRLANLDALVVLDNLETVEEEQAAVSFLDELPCPILITSRTRPAGVQIVELPSLSPEEAISLFQRVSGLEPEELDETTTSLCMLDLGGHPLALEVTGALVASGLDTAELRGYLQEMPLDVLGETARDAGRSVVEALQLSYQRLSPMSQALLMRMSVFPGRFDLAALAALSPEHSRLHQVKGLRELVARSLLTQISRQRYRLHPVTRQFAYALLEDPATYHRRAGAYFMTEAGADSLAAVSQFLRAGDQSEAADLVPEHVDAWIQDGRASEALATCNSFALNELEAEARAGVHEACGDLLYLLGELDAAVQQYDEAAAGTAEPVAKARLARKAADVLARQGGHDEALARLTEGRDLLAQVGSAAGEDARLAVSYGTALLALGRYDEVVAGAQTALDSLPSVSASPRVAADLHDLIGKVCFFRGNFAQGMEQFQSALALRETCADQQGMIRSYSNLAVVYGEQNRYEQARQANEAALEIAERLEDRVALATLYMNMAADAIEQGSYHQAIDYGEHTLALGSKMGDTYILSIAHHNLGEAHRLTKRFDQAIVHLEQAIELAEQAEDRHGVVYALKELAEVRFSQGKVEEARTYCQRSLDMAEAAGDPFWQPESLDLMGRIHHTVGRWDEGRAAFRQASQIWRTREAQRDLAATLLNWAKLEHSASQEDRARELCAEAAVLAGESQAGDLGTQTAALLHKLNSRGEENR